MSREQRKEKKEERKKQMADKREGNFMKDGIQAAGELIYVDLKVIPGASKNEIVGVRDERLCVKIAAVAEDGKANECLRGFFAKTFGCAKRDVAVVKGEKARLKTISLPAACGELLKKYVGAD